MNKALLSLALVLFSIQSFSQCSFSSSVSGDSLTISFGDTLSPFFDIDSVALDFGDGSTITMPNVPTNSIFNFVTTHQYASSGQYIVCLLEYTDWGGSPQPPCSHCDTINIGCAISAAYSSVVNANVVDFTNLSICPTCTAADYHWSFGDGVDQYVFSPQHTYFSIGTYVVCLYISGFGACSDTICTSIPILSLGLNDLEHTSLAVFPNPASNKVSVSLPVMQGDGIVRVLDFAGREIKTMPIELSSKMIDLDVSQIASGIYFIQVQSDFGIMTGKFVKN